MSAAADDEEIIEEEDGLPVLISDVRGSDVGLAGTPASRAAAARAAAAAGAGGAGSGGAGGGGAGGGGAGGGDGLSASDSLAAAPQVAPGGVPPGQRMVSVEELKRWTAIYPCYFDAALSTAQGRRLPRSRLAGCEHVSAYDLAEAVQRLGLAFILQNKRHPRSDPFTPWNGRALVELFYAADSPQARAAAAEGRKRPPLKGLIATKEELLRAVAREIALLPNRKGRLQFVEQQQAKVKELEALRASGRAADPRAGKMSKAEIKAAVKKNMKIAADKKQAEAALEGRGGQALHIRGMD
jgi:signal recognition particle subunit SEC65